MKQENKELLLKDLCARLPYGVVIQTVGVGGCSTQGELQYIENVSNNFFVYHGDICLGYEVGHDDIKPYLFPLSSMTEEQKKELENMDWSIDDSVINNIIECLGNHRQFVTHFNCLALIEWCYKNHFDIYGLIPMELAIDATGLNIYKNG